MAFRRIFLFLGLFFFWLSAKSQSWCGLPEVTEEQKQMLLQSTINNSYLQKARKGTTYVIYVKPKIINSPSANPLLETTQVIELINKLNEIFSSINLKFVVEGNFVQKIYDEQFYNLKTAEDGSLKAKYNSDDAINLYFTHTIIKPDLAQLNGYTSLPNLSKGSNTIILSYLDNTVSQFAFLKDKIIAHEFGHYFGLLHTYQDSNNSDINKRELVTRGIGANCNTAGDQLCDTPADPFERVPSIFSIDCESKIPNTIYDFNGDYYTPPVDNFMSYQTKCGFSFTPMQFQKMESGLNIRLSPQAEYDITKDVSNFVSIDYLEKTVFCQGEEMIIDFVKNGNYDLKNELSIEVSDKNGLNFRNFSNFEIISENKLKLKLSPTLEPGNNYRLILKTSLPYTESPLSDHFEIQALPTVEISTSQKTINEGDDIQLNIKFGGTGPWNFTDWDGNKYEKINSSSISFSLNPPESKLFTISQIGNECGTISQKPSVYVEVLKPSIKIQDNGTFCYTNLINLPLEGLMPNQSADYYKVTIKGLNQNISILPNFTENAIWFYLPEEIQKDKSYTLKIAGKSLGDFSNTMPFIVKSPPEQPSIVTPINVCYGEENIFLQANGQNLKWYAEEESNNFTYSVLLNTKDTGTSNYYVSQSDSNGCESRKSKMEVNINAPVSAEILGNSTIFLGDSAFLKIHLTGLPPWNLDIENIGNYNVSNEDVYINVKPNKTSTYKVKSISNHCGEGTISGLATVEVISILGVEPSENINVKVFPNPISNGILNFEIENDKISEVIILDLLGKEILKEKMDNVTLGKLEISNLLSGRYILELRGKEKMYYKQIIK
ncbi:T9SS C-terminal target domain-containing protein [Lacihabitans sp. LS3-19]|uniref:T9SS type A sorting domain-containing protein n=1 Tax=Lacihabitans sp. LS3-19 TaxID=2487335 RepID=UPI0020CBB0F6|nr:T9SS type A sorting domain-containing protein [Lacihabitans sp. LS3-19]MCP9767502.1 T9SS C-terminal target domain-containing protein [Lacihabitans sp. LS3-19]